MAKNLGTTGFVNHKDTFEGIYRGKVLDNNDPLKYGRIKVEVYPMLVIDSTVTNPLTSAILPWAIPAYSIWEGAGSDTGYFAVPAVDSYVYVFFEQGNVYQPVYFAEAPTATLGLPSERTTNYPDRKVLKTSSGVVFYVDDTSGSEVIKIIHPIGSNAFIDKETINLIHSTDSSIIIDKDGNIKITPNNAHQTIIRTLSYTTKTYSTSTVLTPEDSGVISVSGDSAFTLPSATTYPGMVYKFIKVDIGVPTPGGTTVTVVGTVTPCILTTIWSTATVISNGSVWGIF